MYKVRACFSKINYAKYVSHLDLMKNIQRAFKRAKIDISYSQGFNPHPILSISNPLPLGVEGFCEYMDFQTDSKPDYVKIKAKLNEVLPSDIRILKVDEAKESLRNLTSAQYNVEVYLMESLDDLVGKIDLFNQLDTIVINKKSKKGIKETDIKPMIRLIDDVVVSENKLNFNCVLANGEPDNLKATVVLDAMGKYIDGFKVDYYKIQRLGFFKDDMTKYTM